MERLDNIIWVTALISVMITTFLGEPWAIISSVFLFIAFLSKAYVYRSFYWLGMALLFIILYVLTIPFRGV